MNPVKVLVVDDHSLFRHGITSTLTAQEGIEVVGEAADGLTAIEKAKELTPDVIIMDLMMPRCSGLEATQALQSEIPQASILILTISDRETDLFSAIKFGARGYMLKDTEPDDLIRAVFHVAQGGVIVSPIMAEKLLTEFTDTKTAAKDQDAPEIDTDLSPREKEVLQLIAQGATNKQIADSLLISENTVKTHLRNIMEKLHMANRSQAVAYAINKGLISYKE